MDSVKIRLGELEESVFGASREGAADSGTGGDEEAPPEATGTDGSAGS